MGGPLSRVQRLLQQNAALLRTKYIFLDTFSDIPGLLPDLELSKHVLHLHRVARHTVITFFVVFYTHCRTASKRGQFVTVLYARSIIDHPELT
jgi:hypothetical protein